MENKITAQFVRLTDSLNHALIAYKSNPFSCGKTWAYVQNNKAFDNLNKGDEFEMPANPRVVYRYHKDTKQRYEYSDGSPQLYLEW